MTPKTELMKKPEGPKEIVEIVGERVRKLMAAGQIDLPADYSAENAVKAAWLKLQGVVDKDGRKALEVCTKPSITNAMFSMVIQGLNPDKNQVYFIPYGQTLNAQRSYFGDIALAKRLNPEIAEIVFQVIYKGDTLKYKIERGKRVITGHEQEFENISNAQIAGAYAIIYGADWAVLDTEIMTIEEIKKSWSKSKTYGSPKGSTHDEFPSEMAIRTVVRRACKPWINASNDSAILANVLREAEAQSVDDAVALEIAEHANATMLPSAGAASEERHEAQPWKEVPEPAGMNPDADDPAPSSGLPLAFDPQPPRQAKKVMGK